MRYAPAIGDSSLDLEEFFSREEVYEDSGHDPNTIDEDDPYIPESDYYRVVSIIQGIYSNYNILIMYAVLRGGGMNGQKLLFYPSVSTISWLLHESETQLRMRAMTRLLYKYIRGITGFYPTNH